MDSKELRDRTMQMAVRAHDLVKPLFRDVETRHVATQLLRAASSVAANYRAACLGRSERGFVAKIGTVREEADETVFWLSFIERAAIVPPGASRETAALKGEAEQLARMFAASYRTAHKKLIEQRRARRAAKHQSASGSPPPTVAA